MTTDSGNRPRWTGKPRFFEIWFLVVFVPETKRAFWLRYSLFAPSPGQPGQPRATIWAAAFDANSSAPAFGVKSIQPIDAYAARLDGSFGIRIGDAEFADGVCRGNTQGGGHALAWDLRFEPGAEQKDRSSWLMSHRLPLPMRVIHAREGMRMHGTITVDGTVIELHDAPAIQKHIWGHRRVDELFWFYCPSFREDRNARIEVTSVRPTRKLFGNVPFPYLSPIWMETSTGPLDLFAAWDLLRNEVRTDQPGKLHVRATSLLRAIEVHADCDPKSLVGYVYRDPSGHDLYVAQSDIANCEVHVFERSHPFGSFRKTRTLTSDQTAAIEFHLPQPLEGVRYIGWDETSLVGG